MNLALESETWFSHLAFLAISSMIPKQISASQFPQFIRSAVVNIGLIDVQRLCKLKHTVQMSHYPCQSQKRAGQSPWSDEPLSPMEVRGLTEDCTACGWQSRSRPPALLIPSLALSPISLAQQSSRCSTWTLRELPALTEPLRRFQNGIMFAKALSL